jgi:oxygen-independent coproporphyrinogen-3 oxidase
VTRLSVGVQSFDDEALKRIGRVHDAGQARAAVEEASSAFETFNIDLMYALPGQDLAALQRDLDQALAFEPPHLSIYHLTLEPNTYFATHPPALPDDDTTSDMLDLIAEHTAARGLQRYEVSAFARPGHRCVHNLNYWGFGDYPGAGAGANGKLTHPSPWSIVRTQQPREPRRYVAHAGAAPAQEILAAGALPFEFALNALRLTQGFERDLFAARTGLGIDSVSPTFGRLQARGLLEEIGECGYRPTPLGSRFLNDAIEAFLPDR